jgi:hypothetical protein
MGEKNENRAEEKGKIRKKKEGEKIGGMLKLNGEKKCIRGNLKAKRMGKIGIKIVILRENIFF